ncbi:ASCH domain-containing protein [Novosphingobium sp. BL-8H]|uniref:ASCH domain-containing protein n=1 Tax=Novosphingobium sp. BL-8H TaxID=3127640 RepID=UPI00375704CA
MSDLIIPVKGIYFDQIKAGTKSHEFRLQTPHWAKRLERRTYRHVVMTRGYPKGGGVEGVTRLTRVWRGYEPRTIQHEHFGPDPVDVFAIDVSEAAV